MQTFFILTIITSLAALPSCSTISVRSKDSSTGSYLGLKQNVSHLTTPSKADQPALPPLNILDIPLSAVADILLLPIDLWEKRHPEKDDSLHLK